MKKLLTTGKAGQEYLAPSTEVFLLATEDAVLVVTSTSIPDVVEEEEGWE